MDRLDNRGNGEGEAILIKCIRHLFGKHDWVPWFVVMNGVLEQHGMVCTICGTHG